ncbi:gag-protease polyprotein [Cucumis melo var. makuwa]|uniref:Gag-protease polyprotein n=1 Tax=Cucumis melo var. makuwa TaxID=1194695 RepID=A0A5D3C2S7_CUCMM|nr:gag-protease polyprotein [Cucumis melo var. makuwa]TYK04736.1 gag-protease polyprotein [Cucumis melo var. makuwa]
MKKLFSASLRYAKQQEFLNLELSDMILKQYDAEFDMLSHFSLDVVRNEAARTDKFVNSLRLDLQGFIRAFRPTTYVERCTCYGRSHGRCCLVGSGVCYKCKQPGHIADFVLRNYRRRPSKLVSW